MKPVWLDEHLHENYKRAGERTGRPMARIVNMILTRGLNEINNDKKLEELFSMIKEED